MLALVLGIVIAADVKPGPAVKAAALDVGDVIGNQVVAVGITLINRGPQLAGVRMDGQTDRVTNSRSVDPDELALGRVFQNVGATGFPVVVIVVGGRADRQQQAFAVLGKHDIAGGVTAGGNIGSQRFRRAGSLQVAVLVGKPDQRSRVGGVHPLRIWTRRVEVDSEYGGQLGELGGLLRLSVRRDASENSDGSAA